MGGRKQAANQSYGYPLTVRDIIRRFFPYGTDPQNENEDPAWENCPKWPGDVFAAAAALVHFSSCYTEPGIAFSRDAVERKAKLRRAERHKAIGKEWTKSGSLDPNRRWWEHIDVHNRSIAFVINSQNAIISALVCEDLARYDPVLPTMTAVGPTLVIALLLDGPQLSSRWPARYATVLAEDPGSSVLTLTSAGMVERSAMPADQNRAVVGLWKDRHAPAKELVLPRDHHGLVLSLNCCGRNQRTLDRRVASELTTEYRLGGCRGVRLSRPPAWLERRSGNA
jgi:hypothetical protein